MKNYLLLLLSASMLPGCIGTEEHFLSVGKVIDSATQQPLSGASVFAQNTT